MIDLEVEISIIDDLNQGRPPWAIAKRYGVSLGDVLTIAAQGGKLRKRDSDKAPGGKEVEPYTCNGEGGELHDRIRMNVWPCPECRRERFQRSHV